MLKNLKFYAFFLPQFHECSYNNEWWGKGFTEWNNVRSAKAQYPGHLQPKIPSNGYYDLANTEVIQRQFEKAVMYGIDGFIFYHYWYEGRRPLGMPLDLILEDKSLDFKFSLCWANHSWTRSWKNRAGSLDVLIEQTYENNYLERCKHYDFLNQVFVDKRCITINEQPMFQIYVPESIPNLSNFISELREFSKKNYNVELHISAMITAWHNDWSYLDFFDSFTLSQPSLALHSPINIFANKFDLLKKKASINAIIRDLPQPLKQILYPIQDILFNKITTFEYEEVWEKLLMQTANVMKSNYKFFPSAFVDFDNTPRYGKRAKVIRGFTPEKFGCYLNRLVDIFSRADDEKIFFINAWNEWGEGMYLEEDTTYGELRLKQINNIKQKFRNAEYLESTLSLSADGNQ